MLIRKWRSTMKTNKTMFVASLLAILLGTTAPKEGHASGTCSATQCTARIVELTLISGRVWIALDVSSEELTKLTDCTVASGQYFTLWPNHMFFKEIFASLRSAQLADRDVRLRPSVGSADCTIDYIRAY